MTWLPCKYSILEYQPLTTPVFPSIRCEDTTGNSNPTWRVNNASDYQHRGLAELRLMGPSFTVLSLNWSSLPSGQARVECSSRPAGRAVQVCTSTQVVTRHGTAQPRLVKTNIFSLSYYLQGANNRRYPCSYYEYYYSKNNYQEERIPVVPRSHIIPQHCPARSLCCCGTVQRKTWHGSLVQDQLYFCAT